MLKDKKNIGIMILIVIVMTASIILISKVMWKNRKFDENISSQEGHQSNSLLFSNEEIKEGMNELSQMMKDKTDRYVLIINGEKVSEKEIAYVNFQRNSEVIHKGEEKKDVISEIIKEYIVAQDAKDKKISLTEEESKRIEERVKKNFQKDSNSTAEMLKATYMDYEEFLEFYMARMKRLEIETKWTLYITEAIKSGELKTESSVFNEKCKECKKYLELEETLSKGVNLIFELIEEYKELLQQKAKIEYMN